MPSESGTANTSDSVISNSLSKKSRVSQKMSQKSIKNIQSRVPPEQSGAPSTLKHKNLRGWGFVRSVLNKRFGFHILSKEDKGFRHGRYRRKDTLRLTKPNHSDSSLLTLQEIAKITRALELEEKYFEGKKSRSGKSSRKSSMAGSLAGPVTFAFLIHSNSFKSIINLDCSYERMVDYVKKLTQHEEKNALIDFIDFDDCESLNLHRLGRDEKVIFHAKPRSTYLPVQVYLDEYNFITHKEVLLHEECMNQIPDILWRIEFDVRVELRKRVRVLHNVGGIVTVWQDMTRVTKEKKQITEQRIKRNKKWNSDSSSGNSSRGTSGYGEKLDVLPIPTPRAKTPEPTINKTKRATLAATFTSAHAVSKMKLGMQKSK